MNVVILVLLRPINFKILQVHSKILAFFVIFYPCFEYLLMMTLNGHGIRWDKDRNLDNYNEAELVCV